MLSTAQYKKGGIYFIGVDSTVRAEVSNYERKVVHPLI